ncbi:MAG: response regulator [Pirellulaceae bacterium]|jgi:CheY-like chemotaxis protein|nr:response regulator [Pirellulaceae bacterium]
MDNDVRVLLVDDDRLILLGLERQLRRKFVIVTASNGDEGLEQLERNEIDAVVSDHNMPEMSGVEFLTRVREQFPHTGRVLLTGSVEVCNRADDLTDAGLVSDVLAKPVHRDVLTAAIERAAG